jgi:phosphoesterase RecJ-like protein
LTTPPPVLDAIRNADSILLATHIPMDGDGLGCGIALLRCLRAMGKQVRFLNEAPVPYVFEFLPGRADVELLGPDDAVPEFDLLFGLDAGDASRLGRIHDERPKGCRVLNVDHHATNERYGDVAWVEADASATGEMVHTLLLDLGAAIDAESAQALLVAIVTDTGRFSYSNTTAGAHEAAADLIRRGADPDEIYRNVYASLPLKVLRLRARAAEAVSLEVGGKAGVLVVEADFGTDLGTIEEDVKDLVDIPIGLEGVLVAALVRGLPNGGTKVSLRSKSDALDVAALSKRHGGGGHVRAAGFSDAAAPTEVAERLRPELEALIVSAGS